MKKRIFLSLACISLIVIFATKAAQATAQIQTSAGSSSGRRPSSEGSELFEKVRKAISSDLKEAQALLEKENSRADEGASRDLVKFQLGYVYFLTEQFEKAALGFHEFLQLKSGLEDYGHFFLALSYLKLSRPADAEIELKKIEKLSPNIKLKNESEIELVKLWLQQKKYREARNRLKTLERNSKGTERFADVIYHLALAERGQNNHSKACYYITRLYEKFPQFEKVKDWGPDLFENKIENEKTNCKVSLNNFKTRVRYLMWAGQDEKAQSEINVVKARLAQENKYLADDLQAQFFLQEGEPQKALELLKPYFITHRSNFQFLMSYASAAARSGEVQSAVGSYYQAYKLSPRSTPGRQALYQSAFLSYQFQDYDGAGRRFREFLKVYPRSGLGRDAKWNLAWLQYLKGDFKGSYQSLSKLKVKRKRRTTSEDRIEYWRAMSLYRIGKVDQARAIFAELSKDRLLGYYAIASEERLKKIDTKLSKPMTESTGTLVRFSNSEMISTAAAADGESKGKEENEDEESVALAAPSSSEDGEEADNDPAQEDGRTEVYTELEGDFKTPILAQKFEKARDLMILGLIDWARWDLFEIEKRTKNRDYLRTLMSEYSMIEHYHRSSYIGHMVFSPARAREGIDGVRFLWEYAYPKAYDKNVQKSAYEFKIPSELIWGIMKAESQYRRDAISPVGALGLMQVMPFTGKKVAQLLGEPTFKATELLQPEKAIRIGGRYLQKLMTGFDRAVPFVAAAYNAGPHRVRTWLASFGGLEMDEFIEHIPFLETRNYVKKVVSNTYIYNRLYGASKDFYLNLSEPIKLRMDQPFYTKEKWDEI